MTRSSGRRRDPTPAKKPNIGMISAAYRTEGLEEDEATFLIALRDVVEANGGVGGLAEHTGLNRTTLYRTLGESGKPTLRNLVAILKERGIAVRFSPE